MSEINFCKCCENILYLYSNEENELYLACKVCGNKEEYEDKEDKCIYSNDFDLDFSETINNNKYINFDNTLPVIENNKNIKCPNEDCECNKDAPSKITYIKYDDDNLKYIYICKLCGQKWKNN